jgi:hypothetical protein
MFTTVKLRDALIFNIYYAFITSVVINKTLLADKTPSEVYIGHFPVDCVFFKIDPLKCLLSMC